MNTDETVVRSTCPRCGTVDVPAESVTVLVGGTSDPIYRFVCPGCDQPVQKPTSPKAVPMLRAAGATVLQVPAEVAERLSVGGAVLEREDLQEFIRMLAVADDLARLATDPPLRRPTLS